MNEARAHHRALRAGLISLSELAGEALSALKAGDAALARARLHELRHEVTGALLPRLAALRDAHKAVETAAEEPADADVSVAPVPIERCAELQRLLEQLQGESTP